jgi:hypothetical protein
MLRLVVFAVIALAVSAGRLRSLREDIDEILKEQGVKKIQSADLDRAHWNWILPRGDGNRLIRSYMTMHKQQHKGDVPKWTVEGSEQQQEEERMGEMEIHIASRVVEEALAVDFALLKYNRRGADSHYKEKYARFDISEAIVNSARKLLKAKANQPHPMVPSRLTAEGAEIIIDAASLNLPVSVLENNKNQFKIIANRCHAWRKSLHPTMPEQSAPVVDGSPTGGGEESPTGTDGPEESPTGTDGPEEIPTGTGEPEESPTGTDKTEEDSTGADDFVPVNPDVFPNPYLGLGGVEGETAKPEAPTGSDDGEATDPEASTGSDDGEATDPEAPTGSDDGEATGPEAPTGADDGEATGPEAPTGSDLESVPTATGVAGEDPISATGSEMEASTGIANEDPDVATTGASTGAGPVVQLGAAMTGGSGESPTGSEESPAKASLMERLEDLKGISNAAVYSFFDSISTNDDALEEMSNEFSTVSIEVAKKVAVAMSEVCNKFWSDTKERKLAVDVLRSIAIRGREIKLERIFRNIVRKEHVSNAPIALGLISKTQLEDIVKSLDYDSQVNIVNIATKNKLFRTEFLSKLGLLVGHLEYEKLSKSGLEDVVMEIVKVEESAENSEKIDKFLLKLESVAKHTASSLVHLGRMIDGDNFNAEYLEMSKQQQGRMKAIVSDSVPETNALANIELSQAKCFLVEGNSLCGADNKFYAHSVEPLLKEGAINDGMRKVEDAFKLVKSFYSEKLFSAECFSAIKDSLCNSFLPKCNEHCEARYACDDSCKNLQDVCPSFLQPLSISTLREGGFRRRQIEAAVPKDIDLFDAAIDRLTKCDRLPFVRSATVPCSSEASPFLSECDEKPTKPVSLVHMEGKIFPTIQDSLDKLLKKKKF